MLAQAVSCLDMGDDKVVQGIPVALRPSDGLP